MDDAVSESAIWLLVADEDNANIYASHDGSSRLLRSVTNTAMPAASLWGPETKNVVPLQGYQSVPRDKRERLRDWAFQLVAILYEGAETGACDGIVIVATREVLEALRRVRPLVVTKLLIAEIVELAPGDIAKAKATPDADNCPIHINPAVNAAQAKATKRASNPFARAFKR